MNDPEAYRGCIGAGKMLTCPTGTVFDIGDPTPDMVHIEDIAHHLSLICRWAGATKRHYSVAQHSLMVSYLVDDHPSLQLAALLHDAHEAYIGDRSRPFKQLMPPLVREWWEWIENRIDLAVCKKFGATLTIMKCEAVKKADMMILAAEGRDMIPMFKEHVEIPHTNSGDPLPDCSEVWPIDYMKPSQAEEQFLARFHYLRNHQ